MGWSGSKELCPGGIAARAAVPDVAGWSGMAAQAGAAARAAVPDVGGWSGMAAQAGAGAHLRLDPLVGPAAVEIRSLSPAAVALRLSMCSKAANGPRPGRQPRPPSSRR